MGKVLGEEKVLVVGVEKVGVEKVLGVVKVHSSPTSSLWLQSSSPIALRGQEIRSSSKPLHSS